MVFSSPMFLFGFLPLVLLAYYSSPKFIKNFILLLFSLAFYAWGEIYYILLMLVSIIINYFIGILLNKTKEDTKLNKLIICVGVGANLTLLITYKYANFITVNINHALVYFDLNPIILEPIHLPLGISFFTFQAISYIVDVYRKEVDCQKNIINLSLYISLFPQLIAGPIVRYIDISKEVINRSHTLTGFASGAKRFIFGLAKKVLIANALGEVADSVFLLTGDDLTMPVAWIGILSYSLQIFFDFSGYSDMAIGLGRMFGFHFRENFNFPYISTSLREFWRRWHISLSLWFRDYVYISLGGNRVSAFRVYINLLIVFILTGFWHGASWNFLVWGLFHGVFLAAEHAGFSTLLNKTWKPFQHLYLLVVVVIGWVFFRSENLADAITFLGSMFNINNFSTTGIQYAQIITTESTIMFIIGIIFCTPIKNLVDRKFAKTLNNTKLPEVALYEIFNILILGSLLYLSLIKVASSTYNPFIYFRF